jgi:hypothetical protein
MRGVITIILGLGILIFGGYKIYNLISNMHKPIVASENATQPQITLTHVDRDGTVWVKIDKSEYYLYIDDNGTHKRLEMK